MRGNGRLEGKSLCRYSTDVHSVHGAVTFTVYASRQHRALISRASDLGIRGLGILMVVGLKTLQVVELGIWPIAVKIDLDQMMCDEWPSLDKGRCNATLTSSNAQA